MECFPREKRKVVTQGQRCANWFVLRKFCVLSRTVDERLLKEPEVLGSSGDSVAGTVTTRTATEMNGLFKPIYKSWGFHHVKTNL